MLDFWQISFLFETGSHVVQANLLLTVSWGGMTWNFWSLCVYLQSAEVTDIGYHSQFLAVLRIEHWLCVYRASPLSNWTTSPAPHKFQLSFCISVFMCMVLCEPLGLFLLQMSPESQSQTPLCFFLDKENLFSDHNSYFRCYIPNNSLLRITCFIDAD